MAKRQKIGENWYRFRRGKLVKIPFQWVGQTVWRARTHKDYRLFHLIPKRNKKEALNKKLLCREFREECKSWRMA